MIRGQTLTAAMKDQENAPNLTKTRPEKPEPDDDGQDSQA
jgi:hypothetical protein